MKAFKKAALALAMAGLCAGASAAAMKDGTYNGVGQGRNGDISVQMTVKAGKIADVKIVKHSETPGISDAAVADAADKVGGDTEIEYGGVLYPFDPLNQLGQSNRRHPMGQLDEANFRGNHPRSQGKANLPGIDIGGTENLPVERLDSLPQQITRPGD